MDLRQILEFLKRRWWLLVCSCLVAGLAAFYLSEQLTPIYRATTTVLVNQTQAPGVIQYNDVLTSERLTSTYAQLVKRRPVLTEVRRRLNLQLDEEALSRKITVSPVRTTQLLRISAEDASPALAASIANTTAQAFIDDNAAQLANRPGTVSIAEQANLPSTPAKPNVRLNTALAAILGLMIGGVVGLVLEYLDDTVKGSQDLESLGGLTSLGTVTRFRSNGRANGGRPNQLRALDAASSEDYRQIRTNIHFSLLGLKSKSILITSTNPGEGKSTTAANLATVLAQAGHSVILLDTDLRRPSLHNYFGTTNSFGLTGLLLSESEEISTALLDTQIPGLKLLPSGPLPPNPSEILMSAEVEKILQRAKERADYVLLDSPPVLAVTDARILAGHVEATILVVESGRTRSEAFQRALNALAQTNARVIGAVLNKVRPRHAGYGYRYSYGYGYRHRGEPTTREVEVRPAEQDKKRTAA